MIRLGWVLWHINHCRLLMPNPLHTYILNVYDLVWFSLVWVLWHINHCRLFNTKSSLYLYIKHMRFGLVGFYGMSTIVCYLMPNPLYTYISNIYDLVWFGFYGISNFVGYLMPNPFYTYEQFYFKQFSLV